MIPNSTTAPVAATGPANMIAWSRGTTPSGITSVDGLVFDDMKPRVVSLFIDPAGKLVNTQASNFDVSDPVQQAKLGAFLTTYQANKELFHAVPSNADPLMVSFVGASLQDGPDATRIEMLKGMPNFVATTDARDGRNTAHAWSIGSPDSGAGEVAVTKVYSAARDLIAAITAGAPVMP